MSDTKWWEPVLETDLYCTSEEREKLAEWEPIIPGFEALREVYGPPAPFEHTVRRGIDAAERIMREPPPPHEPRYYVSPERYQRILTGKDWLCRVVGMPVDPEWEREFSAKRHEEEE